jgi:hypothetical protein
MSIYTLNFALKASSLTMLSEVLTQNRNPRLIPKQLTALCTSQCLADLNKAKDAIGQACSLPQDVIEIDRVRFPGECLEICLIRLHPLKYL